MTEETELRTIELNTKFQRERELPEWLQSIGVGSEVQIDGRENSPTRLPPAFSSVSRDFIRPGSEKRNILSGRYTWMGEGWVNQFVVKKTHPAEKAKRVIISLRVAILRKTYPYTRKHPRYYFIPLDEE